MSDFEPSPRSSKRRKVATYSSRSSAMARTSPSTYGSISQSVTSISRRLFNSRDSEDELAAVVESANVPDSAYGSKEDSQNEDVTTGAVNVPRAKGNAEGSESADELARAEVTMTPTKPRRKSARQKDETPKTVEKAAIIRGSDEETEKTPVTTRSSGRERKRPRRFSNTGEDRSRPTLPKGILTPSRKGNRSRRKLVAFEQIGSATEEDLGFKDLDKTADKKTGRTKWRKESYADDKVQRRVGKDLDHICQDTANYEESSKSQIEDAPVPVIPDPPDITTTPSIDFPSTVADPLLDPVRSFILSRLIGETLTPLSTLEAEYSSLHSLLLATATAGEGNSILLLGSRGVGKTCMVETAIADLAIEHADNFHVVRLNGFIQTDDKLALREIWRQLGREMQVGEDETGQVNTYADTMASLLHLLSHPEELTETLDPDAPASTTKSIIFVLDEFDLFTTHPRQTLLYNLFDIAQARKAPVAVIGCSARVDVTDRLEKRVKSRFSHRWIHLSQAKSFPAFEKIAKAGLMLGENDQDHDGQSITTNTRTDWNAFIEKVFLPSSHVQSLLKHHFYTTKSIPDLFSSLYIDIASIKSLDQTHLNTEVPSSLPAPDTVLNLLPHLPTLHLSLVISAARLDAIHNATVVTFALAYNHYVDLVSRARLQASAAGSIAQATKLWNQDVASAVWEELAEWEIILPASGKGVEGEQAKMWRCDVVLEEIIGAVGGADAGMSDVMVRWCKEI